MSVTGNTAFLTLISMYPDPSTAGNFVGTFQFTYGTYVDTFTAEITATNLLTALALNTFMNGLLTTHKSAAPSGVALQQLYTGITVSG